jgi:hypothetical protein
MMQSKTNTEAIRGAKGLIDAEHILRIPEVTVPDSTHLVQTGPSLYELQMDTAIGPAPLIENIQIDDYGALRNPEHIALQINEFNANHQSIQLFHEIISNTFPLPKEQTSISTIEWKVSQWNVYPGGLVEKLLHTPGLETIPHKTEAGNALINLFKGYEFCHHYENVTLPGIEHAWTSLPHVPSSPELLWYKALPSDTTFTNLPMSLFGDEALMLIAKRVSTLTDIQLDGIKSGNTNIQTYETLSPVDKIYWEIGIQSDQSIFRSLSNEKLDSIQHWVTDQFTPTASISNHWFGITLEEKTE